MEEPARAVGAVSECQGQRPRSVQEIRYAGDHLSEGAGLWRVAAPLFGRALTDFGARCPPTPKRQPPGSAGRTSQGISPRPAHRLLRLDARDLDHLGPLFGFVGEE